VDGTAGRAHLDYYPRATTRCGPAPDTQCAGTSALGRKRGRESRRNLQGPPPRMLPTVDACILYPGPHICNPYHNGRNAVATCSCCEHSPKTSSSTLLRTRRVRRCRVFADSGSTAVLDLPGPGCATELAACEHLMRNYSSFAVRYKNFQRATIEVDAEYTIVFAHSLLIFSSILKNISLLHPCTITIRLNNSISFVPQSSFVRQHGNRYARQLPHRPARTDFQSRLAPEYGHHEQSTFLMKLITTTDLCINLGRPAPRYQVVSDRRGKHMSIDQDAKVVGVYI
jgi:hypothetical protein